MRSAKTLTYVIGILFSAIYILNPTAGMFELLPDNLPVVGNLDEAAMVTLLLACLRGLRQHRAEGRLPQGETSVDERGDLGVHRRDGLSGSLL